ncbi:hypothetical protein [Streptomyces abikoensis]
MPTITVPGYTVLGVVDFTQIGDGITYALTLVLWNDRDGGTLYSYAPENCACEEDESITIADLNGVYPDPANVRVIDSIADLAGELYDEWEHLASHNAAKTEAEIREALRAVAVKVTETAA